ncbi:TonB-dependent receptor [Desulfatitalea alkaliphila]|uniref:TonB-dependent receptor n=1 Tax=Desulfatitalea alkaliphila TaxID=2929485 RepID=A0AA41UHL9_9BACT|nr:TonB-dependent receptor [Desulfatitalea alkaliphila]MCJ8499755.1 TonB-dependent receptor [Desulfatitalea alkaliphila]
MPKRHLWIVAFVLIVLILAPPAAPAADAPPVALDDIVVSARGVESRISDTPGGIGLVDAEDVHRDQPIGIADALRRIPGVTISPDSPWGAEVNIRGLGRGRVVFLIDGCRVNTATDLNAQFGLIDPAEIERIEVLKGPVSALYGSGAIGGVVNVITRKGRFSDTTEAGGTVTSVYKSNPDGFGTHAGLMLNNPRFWVYGSGNLRDYDSYKDGTGTVIPNSRFKDYGGALKAGFKWNPLNHTQIQYQHHEGAEIGIPGTGEASLPAVADVTYPRTSRKLIDLTHSFTPARGAWEGSVVNLFHQEIDRNVRVDRLPAAGPITSIHPSAHHRTRGFKWFNSIRGGDHRLSIGADIWQWAITSERTRRFANGTVGIDQPVADAKQLSAGLFLEDHWRLGDTLALNAGGRIDLIRAESEAHYVWLQPPQAGAPNPLKRPADEYEDTSWDAHLGLTWRFLPDWSMTFLGASSYRAPDLMERFKYIHLGSYEVYGSPDLDPERSLFFEYGLHYIRPRLVMGLGAFWNRVDDLIVELPVAADRREMANVAEARIYGAEASVQWRFMPLWSAYATAAYTVGRNRTEDRDLADIPPLNGVAGIRRDAAIGLNGHLEMAWASRQSKVGPAEHETPGWQTLNAGLAYRFQWAGTVQELGLAAHNLLDATYREHLSTGRKPALLNAPGRSVLATWRMTF